MGIESISPASGSGYQGGVSAPLEEVPVQAEKPAVPQNNPEPRQSQEFYTDEKSQETPDASVKSAVEELNKSSQSTEAIYGYHEGMHRYTIKIVDKDTKEVVKEYPSEKRLDLIQKVLENAGLIVDEKR